MRARLPSPDASLASRKSSAINGHCGRRNGILQNELYRGQVVYNRVRMVKDAETGKRISRINAEKEWVRVQVPELRILSDVLWDKVQTTRRRYRDQPTQNCRRPKRLLSGLLKCGQCGGAFTMVRPGKYGCATHREKGTCTNATQISASQLERRVLAGVKKELLQLSLLTTFVDEFQSELRRLQENTTRLGSESRRQLDNLGKKIHRIVDAIAEGTDTPSLRRALLSLEHEKAELEKAVARHHGLTFVKSAPLPTLLHSSGERLNSLKRILAQNQLSQLKQLPSCAPSSRESFCTPVRNERRCRSRFTGNQALYFCSPMTRAQRIATG
jgi:Recombinase zinc beta ribbon domain/Recombinase